MTKETNYAKPGRFTIYKWKLSALIFSTVIHLFLFIISLIKWLLSPIALLFMIFVGIPFGRFAVKVPVKPNFRGIDESDVPDEVWLDLEQSKQIFLRAGFTQGKYIMVDNIAKNQEIHTLLMFNRPEHVAVGISCISLNPGKKHESRLISCEFTTRCPDGETIDLTSTSENDPYPISSRQRVFFNTDENSLYQLFLKLIDKKACPCPDDIIDTLANTPEIITFEEYHNSLSEGLINNYVTIKDENYHLTWKGAFSSAYRTLWPTSELFERNKENQAKEFFQDINIDLNAYDWLEDQEEKFTEQLKIKIKGINTAIEASKNLACKFDSQAKVVGLIVNNAYDKKGIESIIILYENYNTLRDGHIHCFNSFSIEHFTDTNTINLIEENNLLLSDEEWHDYEITPKSPLPEQLTGICAAKEASAIALEAIRNRMNNNKYLVESLELNKNISDETLVWIIDTYISEDNEDSADVISVQCIINARNKEIISVEVN